MKIPTTINPEMNNFDFLRLFAAFLVFFGHAILITRSSGFLNWDRGVAIGALGVNIFFVISGFLITKSWIVNDNFLSFAKKRFLRIYPALVAIGLFTILVIGPINTFFTSDNYFRAASTLVYIKNIFLLNLLALDNNVLPGVFVLNKLPLIVNASLWTIPIEIGCYILVILFGLKGLFGKKIVFLYLLLFLLIYGAASSLNKDFSLFFRGGLGFAYPDIVRLLTYFVFGMVLYLYRESISVSKKHFFLILLFFFGSMFAGYFELISYFLLPIIVIITAFTKYDFPKKFTHYGDFSYGFYLFAFPVQQTVSSFSDGRLSFSAQVSISFFLTMFLAVLSWNFIEKPCLKFKNFSFSFHMKKLFAKS